MRLGWTRAAQGRSDAPGATLVVSALLGLVVAAPNPLAAAELDLIPPPSGSGSFWSAALWDSAGGNVSPGPTDDLTISGTLSPLQLLLGETIDEPARRGQIFSLAVLDSQAVTIDGAGDLPTAPRGSLNLKQGPDLNCRIDGTKCSLVVSADPGTGLELRDAPTIMTGDAQLIQGTLAITKTVDSSFLFGSHFISPYVQLGGQPALEDPSRSSFVVSGHGAAPYTAPTARIHAFIIVGIDDTALRVTDGAGINVYNMDVKNIQNPPAFLPGTTRIEIGDAVSDTARLILETAAFEGQSSNVRLEAAGRDLEMIVAPHGEVELTGDSSATYRSNIEVIAREGLDPGHALLEVDGGLLKVTTPLPAVVPSSARFDVSVVAREGGTATLRVDHGGEVRGSNTAIARGHKLGAPPTSPQGIAALEIATGGLVTNGNLYLAGSALDVSEGILRAETLSLSDPLAQLGQEPSQATWHTTDSRLESEGLSLAVYSGSTARFEGGAVGTDVRSTQVGGSAFGIPTGIAPSRLEIAAPGTHYDTGSLSIGLPGYAAHYGAASECPVAFGIGSGIVEVTNGASLDVGNAQNVPGDPIGIRPSIALAPAHDEYAASELRLDATSTVVIAASGSAAPQPGKIVVGQDGQLAGSGIISGDTPLTSPDVVMLAGGRVAPGCSPGTLTIAGRYVQQDGELELEIGGPNPGEFDVIDAQGGAELFGGTLRFEIIDGYTGDVGAQLDLFASHGISIDPSVVVVDNTGLALDFDRTTGIATITQTVPEPAMVASLAAGLVLLRGLSGRRRRATR